ncbi:MAG: BON domain-containing protein [Acidobacteriia bacterium]|nr:BON domain-containing protein [Terriglobia bacterium]
MEDKKMKTINRLYLGLLLAPLLAVPVWAQQPDTQQPNPRTTATSTGRYDQQIQQQVTKLLGSKDKWKGISATTEDGIVTLQGSVKLYIDKADVARKVNRIEHAEGVRNQVQVEGNVADAELQSKLADKLRYDRIGFGIMFNSLGLKVENGVVTVSGDVHDYPSRDSAIAIVETTPGVKDVIDEINVLPTSGFDDDLRIRIARAIYGDSTLRKYAIDPQKPIRIIVDNGHVTLEGVVNSQLDKQLAGVRANSVPNVFSVTNNLMVPGKKGK